MKKIYKLFLASVFLTGALFQSCETTELELIDDPNNLTSGDPVFLLNRIQSDYRTSQFDYSDISSDLTRIDYMFGRNYFSNYAANRLNNRWNDLYSDILPDIQAIEAAQAEDNDLRYHISISKIMQAHLMMQMVDLIGNIVPMSQATNPSEFPTPEISTDGGASSYADAVTILNDAIATLSAPDITTVADLYYAGDASKWIKFANTLKLRAALTTSDFTTFNSLIAAGNYISSTDDDMQFTYGTQLAPVNTQHPDYQNDYTTSGANIYQSTWLMQTMLNNDDPRRRYYFYRQTDCTPGASCDPAGNGETLQCSLQTAPTHLQGTPCEDIFCFMEDGYWGRMHGNDEGTPPDGFTRTAAGVYPASGRFDDDRFEGVFFGQAGQGAGIHPIMLASYVDFWRAEVALAQGQAGTAGTHMMNGLTKSIAKVQSFIGLDPEADTSFAPDAPTVTAYISGIVADFNAATGDAQWNILAEQNFTTLYGGGGTTAHNFYRRTGYPTTVCPNIDPAPGNYPRTLLYPSNEVAVNGTITQRTDNNEPVFWNTQTLPSAN